MSNPLIPKIPRLIHAVWYGSALPAEVSKRIESWQQLNPDFHLKLWREPDTPSHLRYVARALKLQNWANASNLMRLWVLCREGGVYLDTDVDLVQPLDSLLSDDCFLGFESGPMDEQLVVNNAVLGCTPHHPFVEECLSTLLTEFDGNEPANLSSPALTTRVLLRRGLVRYGDQILSNGQIRLYGQEVFYPVVPRHESESNSRTVHPSTVAIHCWQHSWRAAEPSFCEQQVTRLVTALLYGLHKLRDASLVADRIARSARRRAARRKLLQDFEIQTGLFRGLQLASGVNTGSSILPKLLGTYEFFVQRVLAGWSARDYSVIYNLGCECGVVLAALASIFPHAQLLGFDVNPQACNIARTNLAAAASRTRIFAREFHWKDIVPLPGRSLMLCDIEGAEKDLFSKHHASLPDDLIIEIHDFKDPSIANCLLKIFEPTHHCRFVYDEAPPLKALTSVTFVSPADLPEFTEEHRPVRMRWLVAERSSTPKLGSRRVEALEPDSKRQTLPARDLHV